MDLFVFFALPLATILLSIVLQRILKSPILVAITIFSIYLIATFAAFSDTLAEALIATIIYTIISYITAVIVKIIYKILKKINNNECERNFVFENRQNNNERCNCGNNGNASNDLLTISCNCNNGVESDLLTVSSNCLTGSDNNNETESMNTVQSNLLEENTGTSTSTTSYQNCPNINRMARRSYRRF